MQRSLSPCLDALTVMLALMMEVPQGSNYAVLPSLTMPSRASWRMKRMRRGKSEAATVTGFMFASCGHVFSESPQ